MNIHNLPSKPRFSICILCYGNHLELAQRCLGSIITSFTEGTEYIQDIRIGLNKPSTELSGYIHSTSQNVTADHQLPVLVYEPTPADSNTFKWPLMRRMFYDPQNKIADLIMWFDDDSYLTDQANWWKDIHEASCVYDIVGLFLKKKYKGNIWQFIETRPWLKPTTSEPKKIQFNNEVVDGVLFPHGAWWTIQRRHIQAYGFPFPVLRHNGGDTLLGEYIRQLDLSIGLINKHVPEVKNMAKVHNLGLLTQSLSSSVVLNSELESTAHNNAPRRGYTEQALGFDFDGSPYNTEHQDFETKVKVYFNKQSINRYILPKV